jgi:hypothetical protein
MHLRPNAYNKFILIAGFSSMVFTGCTHDKDMDYHTASYHIALSEKLDIPDAIALPDNKPFGNKRVATFYAVGYQKYKAQQKPGSDPAVFEWVFVAPEAKLYDISNKKVGTHSAGPTWQLSAMDSIYGQAFSPARTASGGAGNIDWLLLMPKTGKTPTGIFANVSYIQRIATKGGKAPAELPTSADKTANVEYTAVYRFSKKNP